LIRDRAASSAEMIEAFGDEALLRAALGIEAALAEAQAREGLITEAAAAIIKTACETPPLGIAELAEEAAHAGTMAIPLVKHLRRAVEAIDREAARAVHLGFTSQDLADSALMLQAKAGAGLIARDSGRLSRALAALARRHATTPMLGRTLLQGALPVTFGLKAAQWLLGIDAAFERFSREAETAIALQFGGATGSLAGLQGKAFAVADRLADTLQLARAPLPWHARRDGIAGLASALAILAGATGKIARDVALLAQGEVAEAFEPRVQGRGGSSAMAHKRNPTGCQVALSAAIRAPGLAMTIVGALPQEHERGLGGWQAEGPVLADLFEVTHGALMAMATVIEGLEVDPEAMARNLDRAEVGRDTGESVALVQRALAHHDRTR
jgi:3-carboxy-cis,cis-muconate cycloisomerase